MKILNLSLDNSVLDPESKTAKRIAEYGNLVDGYFVVAPGKDKKEAKISEKVFVYGAGERSRVFKLANVCRAARKLLKEEKIDVITVQDQYYLALLGLFLARKFKTGLELQIHGFEKYSGLRKMIAGFVIPRADAVRCVSQRLKRQLISEFGVGEEKITVAPINVNLRSQTLPTGRQVSNIKSVEIKTENDKFIFLTVGRLVPVKNIGLQIGAMAEVVKKYPNAELWIVGDGPERASCEWQIANGKLENNIKLFGWQKNPEEFYNQADAFLLTSNYEGWGMAVVEAASFGLPIIMTDVGCAGEFIENEKSGLVVPVGGKIELEEAMARLMEDGVLRKKLSEGALLAIKNLPSKEETMALYKQSWEKALNKKPKLLIITQKVDMNDDVLGFFHNWLEKLAEKADLFVVANQVGEYKLPVNVKVFSLRKEKGRGKIVKFFKYRWLLFKLLPKSDGVFYHMCPEYVIGAGLCPKIFRKKTLLWYTHKSVSWKLKLAEKLVDKIFTASKESFRLPSKKIEVAGHGIDVEKFKYKRSKVNPPAGGQDSKFKIITAGRIAEVKNLHLLIEVADILKDKNTVFSIKIAGAPILESDKKYFESLKQKIKEKKLEDMIEFVGPIPNRNIADFYKGGDLFVNLSDTGSLDKAVLEAMACELEILTSNEAFKNILPEENMAPKDSFAIAEKIEKIAKQGSSVRSDFIKYVSDSHSLNVLAGKIINFFRVR